jgi:hypothetical protein
MNTVQNLANLAMEKVAYYINTKKISCSVSLPTHILDDVILDLDDDVLLNFSHHPTIKEHLHSRDFIWNLNKDTPPSVWVKRYKRRFRTEPCGDPRKTYLTEFLGHWNWIAMEFELYLQKKENISEKDASIVFRHSSNTYPFKKGRIVVFLVAVDAVRFKRFCKLVFHNDLYFMYQMYSNVGHKLVSTCVMERPLTEREFTTMPAVDCYRYSLNDETWKHKPRHDFWVSGIVPTYVRYQIRMLKEPTDTLTEFYMKAQFISPLLISARLVNDTVEFMATNKHDAKMLHYLCPKLFPNFKDMEFQEWGVVVFLEMLTYSFNQNKIK